MKLDEMLEEYYEEEQPLELTADERFDQLELLTEWHDMYHAVFQMEINGISFFFRQLTEPEFERIEQVFENIDEREEAICRLCILDPLIEDWTENIYGGYVEAIAQKILEESFFIEGSGARFEGELQKHQNDMQLLQHQLPCIIKEVFPEYRLDEIQGWGRSKQAYYYGRAIWMLENLRGVSLRPVEE